MVLAGLGDTGRLPFSHHDGCRNEAHRFNHDPARADQGRGCRLLPYVDLAIDEASPEGHTVGAHCGRRYFVDSWAMSWSELGPVTHEIEQIQ